MSTGTQIATITIDGSATTVYAPMAGSAPTVGDGSLKLKKDSGTATAFYTANQTGDSTLQYTTATIYHASTSTAFSQGTLPTLSTTNISADDITSWVTNIPTGITFSPLSSSATASTPTTLVILVDEGSAASLSYTSRSIPNVTSVGTLPTLSLKSDTVVTGLSTS